MYGLRISLGVGAILLVFLFLQIPHAPSWQDIDVFHSEKPIANPSPSSNAKPFPSTVSAPDFAQPSQSRPALVPVSRPASAVSQIYDPETDPEYATHGQRPKFGVVSMLYGTNELYVRAIETHVRHAKRHGYPAYVLREELIEGIWNKLLWIIHAMVLELHKGDQGAEWLMWFDADSAVVNPALPLDIFLPPADFQDIWFIASKDQNGFNAGMFFIKVNSWAIAILSQALTYQHFRPEADLGFLEQTTLYLTLNETDHLKHVMYQPRPWFNTYEFHHAYEGDRGDMFVHFPGLEDDRWDHMAKWLDILEGPGQVEWDVDFADTRYPARLEEFWALMRQCQDRLKQVEEWKRRDPPEIFVAAAEEFETAYHQLSGDIAQVKQALEHISDVMDVMQADLGSGSGEWPPPPG